MLNARSCMGPSQKRKTKPMEGLSLVGKLLECSGRGLFDQFAEWAQTVRDTSTVCSVWNVVDFYEFVGSSKLSSLFPFLCAKSWFLCASARMCTQNYSRSKVKQRKKEKNGERKNRRILIYLSCSECGTSTQQAAFLGMFQNEFERKMQCMHFRIQPQETNSETGLTTKHYEQARLQWNENARVWKLKEKKTQRKQVMGARENHKQFPNKFRIHFKAKLRMRSSLAPKCKPSTFEGVTWFCQVHGINYY